MTDLERLFLTVPGSPVRLGVVSDTHGFLDPRVVEALEGVDHILHAGDIGAEEVLEGLSLVAPVTAVRGNNDRLPPLSALPEHALVEAFGVRVQVVHERPRALDLAEHVLVFGHSHRACLEDAGTRLLLNPGAAGRAGFHREVGVAILTLSESGADARLVALGAKARRRP